MKRKFTKSPVLATKSDGVQVAKQMYQNRADALREVDSDDYRYLRDLMNQEVDDLKSQGIDWSQYKPSKLLRQEAKSRGYSIERVRAQGAFPYCIGHRTGDAVESSIVVSSEELLPDDFEDMIPEEDFYKLLHFGKDTVEEYYEECNYIESIYGGDCGVESVQHISQSLYQVKVSVELEVDYDDGDSGIESGTVILSYDMNTHEVDLVDASGIGE